MIPLRRVPRTRWSAQQPSYRAAKPSVIEAALKRAEARPSGNWYVLASSRAIRCDRPYGATVAGTELVAWRDAVGVLTVGPGACPHLGAPLAKGRIDCGELVCRWHGLRLDAQGTYGWGALPSHDDGVLAWVRLDQAGGEQPLPRPVLPRRPCLASSVDAVAGVTGICEPSDIIANRLDPWHGAWFHPYSFTRLDVLAAPDEQDVDDEDDSFDVSVTFRVGAGFGVPVRAEFSCPEPRTVVMRVVDGEGAGSVVETHATPLGPGRDGQARTAVIEAILANSDRRGFAAARVSAPVLRPLIRRAATRLWRDDLAYAERRYALRNR